MYISCYLGTEPSQNIYMKEAITSLNKARLSNERCRACVNNPQAIDYDRLITLGTDEVADNSQ